ncbi:hypothetical protein OSTOST_08647 [Ostertagia ostertagi]
MTGVEAVSNSEPAEVVDSNVKDSFVQYRIQDLLETYSDIRLIRRDGNCFYRAVLVAQIELMLNDREECARFEQISRGWQDRLIKLGYPDFTTTDFCEVFYKWMTPIWTHQADRKKIFEDLNDDGEANYLIIFLRLITAGFLKEHSEEYAPFIEDCSLSDYCTTEIESMWKDADHLAVTGLVNAIG